MVKNRVKNRVNPETRILLLLLFILCGAGHVRCADYIKKVGLSHTFTPTISGKPESILWKLNSDKVVEFEDEQVVWFQFKDQGDLDKRTGALTLSNLNKGNSGTYEAEILVSGKIQESRDSLKVMDDVGLPTISCENFPDGLRTLTCSVRDSVEPVEYNWSTPHGLFKGKTVNVSKETKPESVYYCTANNAVDKHSNQFTLEQCNPGPGPVGIIVGCVVGVIILIAAILCVLFRDKIRTYLPVPSK